MFLTSLNVTQNVWETVVAKHAKFIPMALMVSSFVSRTARAGRWSQVILNGRKDLRCSVTYFSSVYNPFTFTKYHFLLIYQPHLNITMKLAQNIVMKWFFQINKWRLLCTLIFLEAKKGSSSQHPARLCKVIRDTGDSIGDGQTGTTESTPKAMETL